MEKNSRVMYASRAQWAVLQWLFHYPSIYLVWSDMYGTCINWSAMWASESARQHMIATVAVFGIDAQSTSKPRIAPLVGSTPRCTFQTFKVLLREDLICRFGKTHYHYQLTPAIRKQFEVDELDKLCITGAQR